MPNNLSIEQRWRIIVLHFDNNLPLQVIARKSQCSVSTVSRVTNLHQETNNVLERKGRGRRVIIRGPQELFFWISIGARRPKTFIGQIKYHVNVLGAIWYHGKSRLVFIKGSSNSTTYLHHIQLAIGNYLQVLHHYSLIHDRTT
ncbi:unnamed protein product [Rotaria sp. Silwood2]|nr:unnamed protein product [Rotaria sp. Silwood2]CAF4650745.1 unnamed protein product [Rotaria sp. Silwood2]